MKEKMRSPNSSNNDTSRCPDLRSSFQTWFSTADILNESLFLSPISLCPLPPLTHSSASCLEIDDGAALEAPISPGGSDDKELFGSTSIGPSVSTLLRGDCCPKSSALALRLSSRVINKVQTRKYNQCA